MKREETRIAFKNHVMAAHFSDNDRSSQIHKVAAPRERGAFHEAVWERLSSVIGGALNLCACVLSGFYDAEAAKCLQTTNQDRSQTILDYIVLPN
jgi:hypothetical protein